uniref:S1 motif domain-containing protein n=1 Tax=Cucumis melo TaxID=3656 RepID=A0A9I9CLX7_CUCME
MDGRALTASSFFAPIDLLRPRRRAVRNLCFNGRLSKFSVLASKEEAELDRWDQMELKFGRLIGEDPKLTLAKIMSKKMNPDASYLEVEKSFYQKKGKSSEVEELSLDGLNLIRPQLKKEMKLKAANKPPGPDIKKPSQAVGKVPVSPKGRVPNVILRKPTIYNEDDVEDKPSRLRMKPNLSLKMSNVLTKEKYSDMTLLRKPEPMTSNEVIDEEKLSGDGYVDNVENIENRASKGSSSDRIDDFTLSKKPEIGGDKTSLESENDTVDVKEKNGIDDLYILERPLNVMSGVSEETEVGSSTNENGKDIDYSSIGLQLHEPSDIDYVENPAALSESFNDILDSTIEVSKKATLLGKPRRVDHSSEETPKLNREEASTPETDLNGALETGSFSAIPALEEHELADWTKAEDLAKSGDRADVEVSFGSLVGFIPYRNLAAKWKFLAFESWLRQKGLDPSTYKQNLGTIGSSGGGSQAFASTRSDSEIDVKDGGELTPDMKLEDLLQIYDREKIKFLSSFVGQKIKVIVVLANRKSRKLVFSMRPKEREELVEKKRSLMTTLQVGDVVKCCIKKIAYFGIFVEIEGVPALIHQTEISWDVNLNPASYFKIGQVVEAKVHQLDFSLERIFLSLKQITPDPLAEALESVVGDHDTMDGRLDSAEVDTEWADVESLIKELQNTEGIEAVSKGRFFLSPGLAPTFQVYMASMYENQYKLLARSGNKVQELMVETSLDKETMKSVILTCTNRVE